MIYPLTNFRRTICLLLAGICIGTTGCSKKTYSWATEEEYYQLPIWKNHVRTYKKLKYPPHTAMVFIGDSMTEGFELNRHFQRDDLVNMGISGDFTSGVINRLSYAIRLQPRSIFIMIGINDILKNIEMERIKTQYSSILEVLKSECPGTFICVQSNLPTAMIGGTEQSNSLVLQKVKELNEFLRTYCATNQIHFADMYNSFTANNGVLNPQYTYDGLHLNEQGYVLWKQEILSLIER